jgi:hypothetical protein
MLSPYHHNIEDYPCHKPTIVSCKVERLHKEGIEYKIENAKEERLK